MFSGNEFLKSNKRECYIRIGRMYIPTINFLKFYVIWEGAVSEFISIPELYIQNFVVVHAFVEEISAEKYETDNLCF